VVESNVVVISGLAVPSLISVSGGEYSVSTNGGSTWSAYSTTTPATVANGNQVKVRQTSSAVPGGTTVATLTIGGVPGTFSVTTIADGTPDVFSFTSLNAVDTGSTYDSNIVTITGIDTPVAISVVGGEFSVSTDGGIHWSAWLSDPSTLTVNTLVQVRLIASPAALTTTTATLTVGGISGSFSITTNANTVKIDLPTASTYPTISAAYTAAANGATISLQGTTFDEDLGYGTAKAVLLKGGYNSDFTANVGNSTVRGTLRVSGGTLRVQNIVIRPRPAATAPGAPTGVSVAAGVTAGITASVSFTAPASNGGSPITSYTVTANPGGIWATGTTSPVALSGLTPQTAYTFSVVATNSVGNSPAATVTNIGTYNITTTWFEPDTQPRDSIFIGTFNYDSINQTVSGLQGLLSESMSGDPIAYNPATGPRGTDNMNWVQLSNQLPNGDTAHTYTWHDAALGGTFATVFRNTNSLTFTTAFGGDGWSPQAGLDIGGVYAGWPAPLVPDNPENAYALIFVPDSLNAANTTGNPLALAWDETTGTGSLGLAHTAYADFLNLVGPGGFNGGGMMGAAGMTATSAHAYSGVGTMGGYPKSQVITVQ